MFVGVDFSPAMLKLAKKHLSDALFIEGDAQSLGFEDGEFDVVVSNFGVCHVPDQPKTLSEIRRVLRPDGKFAMTVWPAPDVSPCFAILTSAIQEHGSKEVAVLRDRHLFRGFSPRGHHPSHRPVFDESPQDLDRLLPNRWIFYTVLKM